MISKFQLRRFLMVLFTGFCILHSSCSSKGNHKNSVDDYQHKLEFSIDLQEEGRIRNSLIELEDLIRSFPDSSEPYFWSAKAYKLLNEDNKVIVNYNKAILLDSLNPKYYNNLGLYFLSINENEKAFYHLSKSFDLDSLNPIIINNLGTVLSAMGADSLAIVYFNKALLINPLYGELYYNRGLSYYFLDDFRKALKDYNIAIQSGANLPSAYLQRGYTHYQLGNFLEACVDFNEALNLGNSEAEEYVVYCQENM